MLDLLSRREKELAQWIAKDLLYKQIALKMNISENTIKNMANTIIAKLGVNSKVGVAVAATKYGCEIDDTRSNGN